MTTTSPIDRLSSVVAGALNLSPDQVTIATSSANQPAWTSLGHLEVILQVEHAFNVRFKSVEMAKLDSIEALADRLGIHSKE